MLSEEAIEARRAYKRRWRVEHRDEINAYHKAWREAHKDRYKMYEENRWNKAAEQMKQK